jgi:phenylalanyl-tRNA synthetase beta subunit
MIISTPFLKTRQFCHILKELKFSAQVFEKHSNIKFHVISPSGIRVDAIRRTDMLELIIMEIRLKL